MSTLTATEAAGWRRVQAVSGLGLSVYTTMHIFNHWAALVSQATHDNILMALRELYQRPHLELLGASVLGTHLLANFKLKGAPPKQDTSSTLQRFTGYFLVGTITMHVVHARVLPWYYDDPADLAAIYDSFSVYKPLALPLYSGLLLAGTYHTYNGIVTSLRRLLGVRLGSVTESALVWLPTVLSAFSMLGISGQLYPIYSFSFRLRR